MLRLFTDFQAVGPGGYVFILRLDGESLGDVAEKLKISKGDKVILDTHEDFEVTGVLDFKYVEYLGAIRGLPTQTGLPGPTNSSGDPVQ